MEEIWKYLVVFLLSGLKFIFGPTLGLSFGMSVPVIAILTTGGMMSMVYLITHFGDPIRNLTVRIFGKRKKKKKVFTSSNRRFVTIWKKYGVKGIALLTPLLLSPPGGTFLANALGGKKQEIITWMWVFSSIFSVVLTLILKYASWLIQDFIILPD